MAEYCLRTLSLTLIIIEGFRARKANISNSTLQISHSEGKVLEIKLFLTYSRKQFLFKISTSIHHMVLNYQQKRSSDSFSKAVNIFVLSVVTDTTKLGFSRHSGSMISNTVGPVFSSTSFACLIHLCPEM